MRTPQRLLLLTAVLCALVAGQRPGAQPSIDPIHYRIALPEPEQRWMQVEVTVPALGSAPVHLRMARSSPGRYALHEFAKNVFDVRITDGAGRILIAARPDAHQWDVTGHDGVVKVAYRVFGDRTDGTYLGIDSSHAHINIPAALMYARGLEDREVVVELQSPPGRAWRAATQLFPTNDALRFSAPNLQYLMDSPIEFGTFLEREFTIPDASARGGDARFRVVVHHSGTDDEVTRFARDLDAIVREERAIFGQLPPFDDGTYTFLADYGPQAVGDGMEHRNSTVITSTRTLAVDRVDLLDTAAHEFFHSWNVERIRPRSLEPFDFADANLSGELWLAEGFTNYFGSLVMMRTGLGALENTLDQWSQWINVVANSPGRRLKSAVEMSRMAPFVDAARAVDPTNWNNTFISYYTFGAAIGLALDLSLRELTAGRATGDDFMRALWAEFGQPGGRAPGYVATPYTVADAKRVLGVVAGDADFASTFFDRYIEGHEVADYQRLLRQAGFVLRQRNPGRASLGLSRVEFGSAGARLLGPTLFDSPAYAAGLAQGDLLISIDGMRVTGSQELERALALKRPGAGVTIALERHGEHLVTHATLGEDPRLELLPAEQAGVALTTDQLTFRKSWLSSRAR